MTREERLQQGLNNLPVFTEPEDIIPILEAKLNAEPQVSSLDEFPSPYELHDMDTAVDIFTKAVAANKKIKLIIDSDCDGLGTYTLWYNFFTHFPYKNIELKITNRKQGYGFIPDHVDDDTGLYITSDNGITAVDATKAANEKGAEVIICDHHQPSEKLGLPKAAAIIDPYHPEDTFEYKDISGTFVLWFFLKALVEKYNIDIDVYEEFKAELAITTVSDVMPLNKHINRFVVQDFINNINEHGDHHRTYVKTFLEEVNANPTAESFAFGLIPMINATQRMTKADHGAMFLVAPDKKSSLEWFNYIKSLNDQRKERQQTLLSYIEKYYKEYINKPFIVIPGKFQKEYAGVLGVISGRLAETNAKPTIVMNYNEAKKQYSGSGRSIGDLDIMSVLKDNPYIVNVGGHKQALGITVSEDQFNNFYNKLQEDIQKVDPDILNPIILPTGRIPINKINWDFFEVLNKFEPFGHRFKKPVFVTRVVIKSSGLMGKQRNHLRFVVTDKSNMISFSGVRFFTEEVPEVGVTYDMYFTMAKDDYKGGDNIKIMAEDFIKINGETK
jgi:single-stranded-DNA-specific exonuclease